MQNFTEISRLQVPKSGFEDYTELFFRLEKKLLSYDGALKNVNILKFNTWMNTFCAKKYFKYCNFSDLYLNIKVNTPCEILIYNYTYMEAYKNSDELVFKHKLEADKDYSILIENPENYENLYFALVYEDTVQPNIYYAFWATTSEKTDNTKLAIISCTFKREKYITKNIDLFKNFVKSNPDLKERVKFYVVDNGQTLDKSIEGDNVTLFPNKNVGGSGGFTRGIIEALHSDENFTRVLLMDDDVEIFPESIYRTLIICDFLKPEYKNSFISGSMINFNDKKMFFENLAQKYGDWVRPYHIEQDITVPMNVARINSIPDCVQTDEKMLPSSAWWYCSFTLDLIRQKGLPLPLFVRTDDLEWSWRNFGEHHISLNGICVWHCGFEFKESKTMRYYFQYRNFSFVNMLYEKDDKKKYFKNLNVVFNAFLIMHDYTSAKILLVALRDMLRGSESFRKDPRIALKEVSDIQKADVFQDIDDMNAYSKVVKKHKKFKEIGAYKYKKMNYELKNFLYKITFKGALVPSVLWKKRKTVWMDAPYFEFLFCKKLYVANFLTNKVEVREYNPKVKKELEKQYNSILPKLKKNYDCIKDDFKSAVVEFRTEEFWRKYLELGQGV